MEKVMTTKNDTQEQEKPQAIQLMVSNLASALEIIDAAITRGAYKGSEISTVGRCRDHLSAIIKSTNAPDESGEEGEKSENPTLVPNDIALTLNVIDVAVSRGAFNGEEATTVGATRDVFAKVVDSFPKKEDESPEGEDKEEKPE